VNEQYMPKSSRNMQYFQNALNNPPFDISSHIVDITNLAKLPQKSPKNKTKITKMTVSEFRFYCKETLRSDDYTVIPVVVIKGKRTWIEWKKPIKIYDEDNEEQWVCISLKYNAANKRWSIECLDYDFGRMYYQHRLVGLDENHSYNYSYQQIAQCCTTSLEFIR